MWSRYLITYKFPNARRGAVLHCCVVNLVHGETEQKGFGTQFPFVLMLLTRLASEVESRYATVRHSGVV